MNLKSKTFFATLGAIAISSAVAASAEAKPFGLKLPPKKPFPHFPHKHNHGYGPKWGWGAAGLGLGLAAGALVAAPAYAGDCYVVRKREWSDYYGAVVVRRVTVCN
jgi:hypothetical protein